MEIKKLTKWISENKGKVALGVLAAPAIVSMLTGALGSAIQETVNEDGTGGVFGQNTDHIVSFLNKASSGGLPTLDADVRVGGGGGTTGTNTGVRSGGAGSNQTIGGGGPSNYNLSFGNNTPRGQNTARLAPETFDESRDGGWFNGHFRQPQTELIGKTSQRIDSDFKSFVKQFEKDNNINRLFEIEIRVTTDRRFDQEFWARSRTNANTDVTAMTPMWRYDWSDWEWTYLGNSEEQARENLEKLASKTAPAPTPTPTPTPTPAPIITQAPTPEPQLTPADNSNTPRPRRTTVTTVATPEPVAEVIETVKAPEPKLQTPVIAVSGENNSVSIQNCNCNFDYDELWAAFEERFPQPQPQTQGATKDNSAGLAWLLFGGGAATGMGVMAGGMAVANAIGKKTKVKKAPIPVKKKKDEKQDESFSVDSIYNLDIR